MTHVDLSLVMLLVGIALGPQRSARQQLDSHSQNTAPLQISTDVDTAIHGIKSVLVNHTYDGSRWRLIQIDAGIGQLVACLDHMEAQRDLRTNETTIARTQVMLLGEFKPEGPHTLARLSWRVLSRAPSVACSQLIAETTNLIRSQLATNLPGASVND